MLFERFLPSGLLLFLKYKDLCERFALVSQMLQSLSSALALFVRDSNPFRAVCSLFFQHSSPFRKVPSVSEILQLLSSGLLHFLKYSSPFRAVSSCVSHTLIVFGRFASVVSSLNSSFFERTSHAPLPCQLCVGAVCSHFLKYSSPLRDPFERFAPVSHTLWSVLRGLALAYRKL